MDSYGRRPMGVGIERKQLESVGIEWDGVEAWASKRRIIWQTPAVGRSHGSAQRCSVLQHLELRRSDQSIMPPCPELVPILLVLLHTYIELLYT